MLDEDADEPLERAQNRAVEHHRAVLLAVLADVTGVQPLGQHGVGLDGADLPGPPDGVGQVEFQLGGIEGALAGQFLPAPFRGVAAGGGDGIAHGLLGPVPHRVAAEALLGAQRQLDGILVEAEIAIDGVEQVAERCDFADQLVLAHEDMRIVLGELAHPHQAVQRAVRLVAVAATELGHADRQLAIAGDTLPEDQHMRRAVHRLDRHQVGLAAQHRRVVLARGYLVGHHEHVLAIFAPVAALLPLLRIHDLRGLDLDIARRIEPAAHIGLEAAPHHVALGVPEHAAMRLGLEVEQVHLLPELAMIAPGSFLQPGQVGVQLLLVQPAGAVDAAQHRVGLVTAPIGARDARQLERRRVQLAGRGQMRPAAHVQPVAAGPVDGQFVALGQFRGPFRLERFTFCRPARDEVGAAPHFAAQRLVGRNDRAHLRLDRRQVLVGERAVFWRKIIVEAVVGARPEGDLGARKQRLHRLGQHVGKVVARQLQRIGFVARGDQRQRRIADKGPGQVDQFAIDPRRQRRLGQAGADRRGDIGRGGARRHRSDGTIGQGDVQHIGHGRRP